ncbi:hypothetical protein PENTCL1PPCAC_22841 [Pristionchus entomophagus]|uniref:Coiled-coil domain-containing protein n=1 Tax=Pristionchus entomophagus TaxID=358040 RepID=A0AAV5U1M0_9BILA|nr:hypothetical protein PENTCL1PPCAC_22841 [Pristionchus entomophagus]
MPKKFTGENSKAVAARARKDGAKEEQAQKKQKATEDAYWADDDKNAMKKQARKEEEEKKKQEAQRRKEENRKAVEDEMKTLTQGKSATPAKVTQATILQRKEQEKKEAEKRALEEKLAASKIIASPENLQENLNLVEESSARNLEDAIALLSTAAPEVDLHPEKRMKASYESYAEVNLPILKEQNPTLRLSQLKQILKKNWLKAPENPINMKMAAMAAVTANSD